MSKEGRIWAESQPCAGWDKAVLWHVGDGHRAETGVCDLSPEAISRRLGCSIKRVRSALKKHVKAGLLTRQRRFQMPSVYTLNFDQAGSVHSANELAPVGKSIRTSEVDVSSTSLAAPGQSEVDVSCKRSGPRGAKKTVTVCEGVAPTAPARERRAALGTTADDSKGHRPIPIAARASAPREGAPTHGDECAPQEARQGDKTARKAADLLQALICDVNRCRSVQSDART